MSKLNFQFIIREGSLVNWIPDAIYTEQSNQKANSTSETFMYLLAKLDVVDN